MSTFDDLQMQLAMAMAPQAPAALPNGQIDPQTLSTMLAPMPIQGGDPLAQPAPVAPQEVVAPPAPQQPQAPQTLAQGGSTSSGQSGSARVSSSYAGVNPQSIPGIQKLYQQGMGATQTGIEQGRQAAMDQAKLEADTTTQMAEAEKAASDSQIEMHDARQAQLEASQAEIESKLELADGEVKRLAETEPDPGRFWSSRTSGQKALYFLIAAAQSIGKPGEVPDVTGQLMKMIDDDISRQDTSLQRQLDAAQGRKQTAKDLYLIDKDVNDKVFTERALRIQAVKSKAAAEIARVGAGSAAAVKYLQADSSANLAYGKALSEYADQSKGLQQQKVSQSLAAAAGKREQRRLDLDIEKHNAAKRGEGAGNMQFLGETGAIKPTLTVKVKDPETGKMVTKKLDPRAPIGIRDDKETRSRLSDAEKALTDSSSAVQGIMTMQQVVREKGPFGARLDPRYIQGQQMVARAAASAMGEGKVLSDPDMKGWKAAQAFAVADPLTGTAALFTSQEEIDRAGDMVTTMLKTSAEDKYRGAVQSAADPNFFGAERPDVAFDWPQALTAQEMAAGAVTQTRETEEKLGLTPELKGKVPALVSGGDQGGRDISSALAQTGRGPDPQSVATLQAYEQAGDPRAKAALEARTELGSLNLSPAEAVAEAKGITSLLPRYGNVDVPGDEFLDRATVLYRGLVKASEADPSNKEYKKAAEELYKTFKRSINK